MSVSNGNVRFLLLIGCLIFWPRAQAAIQADPFPIVASDGSTLGYVHAFSPEVAANPLHQVQPVVYLPGFDIDLAALISDEGGSLTGTRGSGLRLARQLVLEGSTAPHSANAQFIEYLVDEQGHTVYVVEYADADAGIEVNAEAVRVLLTHPDLPIRSRYQSDGVRAVVIGWSMGGLIGRYALAALEQEMQDHYSAIYLSFDAPHQGAYLPLSLEAFVGLMQEVIDNNGSAAALSEFKQLLAGASSKYNSVSAKQLLSVHIGRDNSALFSATLARRYNQIMNEPATKAAHVDFYAIRDKLQLMGDYPAYVRNVALSNGNAQGNRLPLPSPRNSNELIRLTASVPLSRRYQLKLMEIRLREDTSQRARSNCSIDFYFQTTACPALMMPPLLANASTNPGSYNTVVSRLTDAFGNQQALRQEWQNLGYTIEFESRVPSGEGAATFISSQSALDIRSPELQLPAESLSQYTPFDAVYLNPSANQPHNSVSNAMAATMANEIQQNRLQKISEQVLPAMLF